MSAINRQRFDLSDRLIHFFRALDIATEDAPLTPEDWGPGALPEDTLLSPFFLMRNAIRLGRLWATWSMRGGRRTIYGKRPAVCFTEMPIGAFIEAGDARSARGEAMSSFGLTFPKASMFERGARPAIYGLSSNSIIPAGHDGVERLIDQSALPLQEQYRYVTYVPNKIDWTHEREWRWPADGYKVSKEKDEFGLPPLHGHDIAGLDFNDVRGIGAVVKTKHQLSRVLADVLTVCDRLPCDECPYEFVIATESIPDLSDIRSPEEVEAVISNAAISVEDFYNQNEAEQERHIQNLEEAICEAGQYITAASGREDGGCWLWIIDAQHPLTRALVLSNRVKIDLEGRYLIDLPSFDTGATLATREAMTKRLSELLFERYQLRTTWYSVLNSREINGIPSYTDPPFDDHLHYNYSLPEDF